MSRIKSSGMTLDQLDGIACVRCGRVFETGSESVPVGVVDGCQVFACVPDCVGRATRRSGCALIRVRNAALTVTDCVVYAADHGFELDPNAVLRGEDDGVLRIHGDEARGWLDALHLRFCEAEGLL